ncbi:MAG: calcium/sodium antiporter [Gammaproteobacteria bacterium]|nr:calcium/sodium antiporter [Gammaproteobacteria bacterium]PCH63531.1 MAG: calcium/sodium antiporter [Gammaproteobacteria bacterium]PCH65031.1 MAG: calcium/sodium antiporter [Gammaproteobacteria bacterium]
MATSIAAVVAGLILLVWSADRFIFGAAQTAIHFKVPPILIGLTIVSIGTSAPEALVSLSAALQGNPGLAIGNVYGSNIANIALVLGVTALVTPLAVNSATLRRELPILLIINIAVIALLFDGTLGQFDGVLLLIAMVVVMYILVRLSRSAGADDPIKTEFDDELKEQGSISKAVVWLLVGLIVLVASAKLLVWGAVNIAHALGVSDLIIGLSIVAIGTSLPELAASVTGALKGEYDLVVGTIVGSNIFNFLLVLAMPALFSPGPFAPEILYRDAMITLSLTVALFLMAMGIRKAGYIMRWEGAILLTTFIAYMVFIYMQSLSVVAA